MSVKYNCLAWLNVKNRFTVSLVTFIRKMSKLVKMVLWNALPGHIIQENNKYRFKELLKDHLLAKHLSVSVNV